MNRIVVVMLVGFTALLLIGQAPTVPWTAVASTGAVDESAQSIFAFTDACVEYKPALTAPGVTGPIEVHYNVVNTFDNRNPPTVPGWTTFELGSAAPAGSAVEAILFKVERCTGKQTELCRVRNTSPAGASLGAICKTCTFAAASLDFANNLYYAKVTLTRTTPNALPRACTLRVF